MDLTEKHEEAIERVLSLQRAGTHNCSQAILCAYADEIGIDKEVARNMAGGLTGGISKKGGTCASLIAAVLVASELVYAAAEGETSKWYANDIAAQVKESFLAELMRTLGPEHAHISCLDILQGKTPPELPCVRVIASAVIAIELAKEKI